MYLSTVRFFFTSLIISLHMTMLSTQVIIYVDSRAPAGGNGRNWNVAYNFLQDALDEAATAPGKVQIWVAAGTYYPDEGANYTDDDRAAAFRMLTNVEIYGGLKNVHTSLSQRDWVANPTILSGDIRQDNTGRSYSIIYNSYTSSDRLNDSAVLDGFILEYSDNILNEGGGIRNEHADPRIEHCLFRHLRARQGAAISNVSSAPVIANSVFHSNASSFGGDVMYNDASNPLLVGCTLAGNVFPGSTLGDETTIYSLSGSTISIHNSILWNTVDELVDAPSHTNSYKVFNSIIYGGAAGTNVIDQDPLFVDPANDDYAFQYCSPALDAGDNKLVLGTLDYANDTRRRYANVDIGAYEFISTRLYVATANTSPGTGTSWAESFKFLGDALDIVSDCEAPVEIWVAQGTYYPDDGFMRTDGDQNASFKLLPNVQIYGGFIGNETALSERIWQTNLCVLSGDIDQDDGTGQSSDNNSYQVVHNDYDASAPLGPSAIIDGFIVARGNALNATGVNRFGGGMRNTFASPMIRNCTFSLNRADQGGGIYSTDGDLTLINCDFFRNQGNGSGGAISCIRATVNVQDCSFIENSIHDRDVAERGAGCLLTQCDGLLRNNSFFNNFGSLGGGLYVSGSDITVDDCVFDGNDADQGGAFYLSTGSSTFTDCIFRDNIAEPFFNGIQSTSLGGAVYIASGNPVFEGCLFDNNHSDHEGGAVMVNAGAPTFERCTFKNNDSFISGYDPNGIVPSGGAIFIRDGASPEINACTFYLNYASELGGAIYSGDASFTLTNSLFYNNCEAGCAGSSLVIEGSNTALISNCTFADSTSVPNLETILLSNASPIFYNSIIWSNAASQINEVAGSSTTFSSCIIKDGYLGVNIMTDDPKFKDPSGGDFSLSDCSPAIDAGINAVLTETTDIAGNPRFHNATGASEPLVDISAYEFQGVFSNDCSGCDEHLTLTGAITESQAALQTITISDAMIPGPDPITFRAGDMIIINPSTGPIENALFEISLEDCQE